MSPTPTPKGSPPAQPALYPQELLPVDKILDDGKNPRIPSKDDEAAIVELVESFKADRLLQPILVYREAGKIHLVFGHRRLAAAKRVGWKKIPAMVMHHTPDEAERERLRAIENLKRKNLNPAEEALAVAQMVDACAGDVDRAADESQKPIKWVRDRLYLQKLAKAVRDQLAAGEIKLAQAREVVKWGDQRDQIRIANKIRDEEKIGGPVTVEEISSWLDEERRPLKTAAWSLEIPFAGKPACNTCPFNSAFNVGLFGPMKRGDDGAAKCSLPPCYLVKLEKSGEEQRKAAEKLKAQVKEKTLSPQAAVSLDVAKERAPAWLKPEALQAVAAAAIPTAAAAGGAAKKPDQAKPPAEKPPTEKQRRQAAVIEWSNEFRKWRAGVVQAIVDSVRTDPHRKTCFMLLQFSEPLANHPAYWAPFTAYDFTGEHKNATAPAAEDPAAPSLAKLLAAVAAGTYDGILELADAVKGDWAEADRFAENMGGPEILQAVAKAFGITAPPPPAFDIFLPQDLQPLKLENTRLHVAGETPADKAHAKKIAEAERDYEFVFDKGGWIHAVTLPDAQVKIKLTPAAAGKFTATVDAVFGRGSAQASRRVIGINDGRQYIGQATAVLSACSFVEAWLRDSVAVTHQKDFDKIATVLGKLEKFVELVRVAITTPTTGAPRHG